MNLHLVAPPSPAPVVNRFKELAREIFHSCPSLPPSDDDLIEFHTLAFEHFVEHPYNGEAKALLNAEGGADYYSRLEALQQYCCGIAYPSVTPI